MTARKEMSKALTAAVALAMLGLFAPASAQAQPADVAVAGGIGVAEREQLAGSPLTGRNVKLVFSLDTGGYVADVHVKVTDGSGKVVVDGVARGPWVYATLPAGRYTVTATYLNESATRQVVVADDRRVTAHVTWPESVEETAYASD